MSKITQEQAYIAKKKSQTQENTTYMNRFKIKYYYYYWLFVKNINANINNINNTFQFLEVIAQDNLHVNNAQLAYK